MNFKNIPEKVITKKELFLTFSQEEMWNYYVPEYNGNRIHSPLRQEGKNEDSDPSFTLTELLDGTIIFSDWGVLNYKGDIIKFIRIKYNLGYLGAINKIYFDLLNNNHTSKESFFVKNTKDVPKVLIEKQSFNFNDFKYWNNKYGVSISLLNEFNVHSVKRLWIYSSSNDDYFHINYSLSEPIYAYEFKHLNNTYYKSYRPLSSKYKFIYSGTKEIVEGFDQLPWIGEKLILTKSMKDVLVLKTFGYSAISLQGEANELTEKFYNHLKSRFENLYILYDNDQPGIDSTNKILKLFNLKNLMIPNEYGAKDISDFREKYGYKETQKFLYKKIDVK
jgi:hypothetical protein